MWSIKLETIYIKEVISKGGFLMQIKVVLEAQDENGYTVHVPSLQGCVGEGKTFEEALKNIKEAILLYFEVDDDDLVEFSNKQFEIIEISI
jgi:predicted RNase H-like HicB family nuclease